MILLLGRQRAPCWGLWGSALRRRERTRASCFLGSDSRAQTRTDAQRVKARHRLGTWLKSRRVATSMLTLSPTPWRRWSAVEPDHSRTDRTGHRSTNTHARRAAPRAGAGCSVLVYPIASTCGLCGVIFRFYHYDATALSDVWRSGEPLKVNAWLTSSDLMLRSQNVE